MKHTPEEICQKLNINIGDIWNIYPYGSRVYLSNSIDSDYDYIIVYKQSLLPSGSFKDNAKTSNDYEIQGTCYSRGGFIDAINNYQMSALEAIFLPDDMIVKKTFDFKLNKFEEKQFVKKVITLASASWHNAILSYKDENYDYVDKNIYHALRILDFGLQIKEHGKIINYGSMNELKLKIYDEIYVCEPKEWYPTFIELSTKLKSNE
jgi:hypothetical protein